MIITALTESSQSPFYTSGFLMRIRRLLEIVAPRSTVAISEMQAAEKKLQGAKKKGQKSRDAINELRSISDLLHQDPDATLPKGFDKKKAPSLHDRIVVHRELLKTTVHKLKQLDAIMIKSNRADQRDVIFDVAFLMSLSIPPQRTAAWREALYGVPESKTMFDPDGSLADSFLAGTPVYICWREETGSYGLSQLRTKTGCKPWLPFPHEMTSLVGLYLKKLHNGYRHYGHPN